MQIRPLAAVAVMLADVAVDSYVLLTRILVGWLYGCARPTMMMIIRIWTACDHAMTSSSSWQARAVHQRADGEEVLAARLPRDAARRHDTEAAEEGVLPGHAARGFEPEHERLARPADRTIAHRVALPVRRTIGAAQVALLLLLWFMRGTRLCERASLLCSREISACTSAFISADLGMIISMMPTHACEEGEGD